MGREKADAALVGEKRRRSSLSGACVDQVSILREEREGGGGENGWREKEKGQDGCRVDSSGVGRDLRV